MLFIQSVTYTLTNPDDGSCELLHTQVTCIEPRSPFATGESKCSWDGSECAFIQPTGSIKIILFVAIFSAIISTPIALTADWIVRNILSANTIKKSKISAGPGSPSAVAELSVTPSTSPTAGKSPKAVDRRSKVRESSLSSVFAAQSELKSLLSELRRYREGLSTTHKAEFDGKFLSGFSCIICD
jgi:hypothetical protein